MTITDINNRVTFYTGLDTTIYLPADRLIAINNAYHKLHSIILESQDEWDFDDKNLTDLAIATTNLVASTNVYALPDTIYKMNKVEINYGAGFIKAQPLDLNETNLSETEVSAYATVESPRYRLFGSTIKFYPTPTSAVTNGIQIYYDREIDEFTSAEVTTGTKEPGFDKLFHDYLAISASIDGGIKFNLTNTNSLENKLVDLENRIRKYYGNKSVDRNYKLTTYLEDYE